MAHGGLFIGGPRPRVLMLVDAAVRLDEGVVRVRTTYAKTLLGILLLACAVAAHAQIDIVPEPQHLVVGQGVFALSRGIRIAAPADARAQWIAAFLRDKILAQTGIATEVVTAPASARIVLRIDRSIHGDEAYRLSITPQQITVVASDDRGLFWGVQSLRQLLPPQHEVRPAIPAVSIIDAPRFPWRGVMLDVSRHFYPVDFIKKQIDLMSYYKFDVFHWHLTDDQGWRIQIRRYPKLTRIGAWRTGPDGHRYGGFYTQKQVREIVAYARDRNVMVVPEIEMPGHTSAAIGAYPELSCSGKPVSVPSAWSGFRNVDCVGKPGTYTFLENVLDEVMALFPSPYVHIGSDEVPLGVWADCTACQRLAKEHALQGETGLHGYFVNRIGRFLTSKGRTMIGWDEMLEGGHLDPNAIVEVWQGPDDASEAFANGNRIILAAPFYLDTPINDRTLEDLYRTDPFDDPPYVQHANLVLGGEAPLWSERATPLNADARLYPRLLAISEHFWNPDAHDWSNFLVRAGAQEAWLAAQQVAYGPEDKDIVDYDVHLVPEYKRWRIRAARGYDDLDLHYTLDGSQPTLESPWFEDVLDLYAPATVRIAPFRGARESQASHVVRLVQNLALGDSVTFAAPPAWRYSGGPQRLTNGILGSSHFYDGSWDGWRGTDMDAVIDLKQPTAIRSVDVRFLVAPGNWILLPRSVSFEVSDDGKTWKSLQTLPLSPDPDGTSTYIRDVVFHADTPITTRYLRVVAPWYGSPLFGVKTWIFSDQIIVR